MPSALSLSISGVHTPAVGSPAAWSPSGFSLAPAGDKHQKIRGSTNATAGTDIAIPFGAVPVGSAGLLAMRNLSPTDNILLSYDTGVNFASKQFEIIPPGHPCIIHASAQVYFKCAAASQPYELFLVEV